MNFCLTLAQIRQTIFSIKISLLRIIRLTEHFGVEMGFNYLLRKRRTGMEFDDENALNVVFSIYL